LTIRDIWGAIKPPRKKDKTMIAFLFKVSLLVAGPLGFVFYGVSKLGL